MDMLDRYFKLEKEIHEYFGYTENWKIIPLDDHKEFYWMLLDGGVRFAKTVEELREEKGDCYFNEIYTQRFLSKYVYVGQDYTMICVDTHTDGNKFLQIFDNSKQIVE